MVSCGHENRNEPEVHGIIEHTQSLATAPFFRSTDSCNEVIQMSTLDDMIDALEEQERDYEVHQGEEVTVSFDSQTSRYELYFEDGEVVGGEIRDGGTLMTMRYQEGTDEMFYCMGRRPRTPGSDWYAMDRFQKMQGFLDVELW